MSTELPHSIIDNPHEYHILRMCYEVKNNGCESFLDLHLAKGDLTRRLRFWSPQDLEIEKGFPQPTSGMQILDVRSHQMDGIGVRVSDSEATLGAITFWARDVIDLENEGADVDAVQAESDD
ncbi:MAG: hypothetical protein COA78_01465 [Blastopirellula sp.]|nr:MAG: hypothetical protein COA78_01465 [Blastopirellula sp.]